MVLENSNLFEKKRLEDFSKKVRDVFNLLTISRSYKVIGSAGLKNIKYSADYDLNELFQESGLLNKEKLLDKILALFQKKFEEAEQNPDYYITDFKCGMDENGEALRWDKTDIKRGYKILDSGRKVSFQECILMKTTMKLDVIAKIDGVFTEFSDNYLIKLGDDANFFPHDIERDHLLNSIKHSFDEYFYAERNYFKGLKRCFSYYLMDGEDKHIGKLKALLEFFNSVSGLLYKLNSEIDTILVLMENTFRKPPTGDLKTNIKIILDRVASTDEAKSAEKYLGLAMNANTAINMRDYLEKSKSILKEVLDKKTLDFISKNKNVLLY
jgi:hypothetical protein